MSADVLPLSMPQTFTVARARNTRFRRVLAQHPETRFVRFVDGDCQVVEDRVKAAPQHLKFHLHHAVVRDECRERFPERSIFNCMCERKWNTPVGNALAAGLRTRRQRIKCRKRAQPVTDTLLLGVVQHFLAQDWLPSQLVGALQRMWPDEPLRTVFQETIHTSIYAMPKGELRRNRIACLRRAKAKRMPRSRGKDRRDQMADLPSIHLSPPKANERAFPRYWEGDLIKGPGNRSAEGAPLERSSRVTMLIKLAKTTAATFQEGCTAKLRSNVEPMHKTVTGPGAGPPSRANRQHWVDGVLLQPAQPLAERLLREHQQANRPAASQGSGSVGPLSGAARCDCRPAQ
ncbi:IS30 family transposase [Hydrogenophaga sp.]|uniref:IS30 family transposase n=1 Tax=Hydrogenophaga sp. TaxID=1904254 RepID=UPI00260ABAAF|nr:IS30 family transposase [Hydrogenophaga sp.]MDM7950727.1 IS30 family transposase [Hydrogenophaga sp.]